MDESIDSSLWLNSETSSSIDIDFESSDDSSARSTFDDSLESSEFAVSDEASHMNDSLESSLCEKSDTPGNSDDNNDIEPHLRQPLYNGAKLSIFESYLLLMQYSLRHSLTKQAVSDLINVIGSHIPLSSTVTQYKLKKYFLDLYEDITFKTHYCCSSCHSSLEAPDAACVNGCLVPAVNFLTVSVEAQLKRKLNRTFWSHLQKRFTAQNSGDIEDVLNGREYQKHQDFLSEPENISLLLNTDGVSMFKSSNISLWPIWVAINELPPHIRFQRHNLILAGLWFGDAKPTMASFLAPFVAEANALSTTGFSVHTPDGREVTARARLLMCSVDLPAKAMVLNTKQLNGRHGCNHCEDEGVPRASSHLHRNWPYTTVSHPRTHDSILANARETLETGEAVKGVKGASVLSAHEHFDLGTGMVINVMHCVFLGVMAKTLMPLWLGVAKYTAPFSIRRKVRECDERLLKIRVPHDFSRTPKGLANVKTWKASEYRSWLLYYSLPVLHGILPDPYFTHYALFVGAVHILMSDSISVGALDTAAE